MKNSKIKSEKKIIKYIIKNNIIKNDYTKYRRFKKGLYRVRS